MHSADVPRAPAGRRLTAGGAAALKDFTFALGRVARALADLNDDPLLGADKEVLRSELEEARETLYGLLRITDYAESEVRERAQNGQRTPKRRVLGA